MFEIVRSPHRQSTARKLSGRLAALSAAVAERQRRLDALAGLVPQVLARTAALSALEQNLAAAVPSAQGRLAFIVDVATAAMTEVVAEDVE